MPVLASAIMERSRSGAHLLEQLLCSAHADKHESLLPGHHHAARKHHLARDQGACAPLVQRMALRLVLDPWGDGDGRWKLGSATGMCGGLVYKAHMRCGQCSVKQSCTHSTY